jgi:hypothetical protein
VLRNKAYLPSKVLLNSYHSDDIRRTRLYPHFNGIDSGSLNWLPLSTAVIQNKPEGVTKVGALPEYALLWPIPLSEMQANTALEGNQNPGWN